MKKHFWHAVDPVFGSEHERCCNCGVYHYFPNEVVPLKGHGTYHPEIQHVPRKKPQSMWGPYHFGHDEPTEDCKK